MGAAPFLSIVIPALNEAVGIGPALARLQPLRGDAELIVVDGGSEDATVRIARALCDRVVESGRGRSTQMNAGAGVARGDVLLFLHADTVLPSGAVEAICEGINGEGRSWGRFDVAISGADPMLAVVAMLMNARSRLTGIATGDQAIFVRREAFEAVGGFPPIPLMEDVALSKALKRLSPPAYLADRVVTSARRWQRAGTFRTIALMWRLRLAFALGADPRRLARAYDVERTSS